MIGVGTLQEITLFIEQDSSFKLYLSRDCCDGMDDDHTILIA
jgi:hypothetical protein